MVTDEYVHGKAISQLCRFTAPCALVFARIHAPLLCRSITRRHGRMPAAALGPADQWWERHAAVTERGCGAYRKVRQLSAFDGIGCMFFGVRAASKSFSGISTSGENGPKAASPDLPNSASRIRARARAGPGAARTRKALPARPGEPGKGPTRAAAPELLRAALGTLRGSVSRGNAARDRPAQTHTWSKDKAGDGNRNDTGWGRGAGRMGGLVDVYARLSFRLSIVAQTVTQWIAVAGADAGAGTWPAVSRL